MQLGHFAAPFHSLSSTSIFNDLPWFLLRVHLNGQDVSSTLCRDFVIKMSIENILDHLNTTGT